MKNLIAHFVVCLLVLIAAQTDGFAAGVVDRGFGTNGTTTTVVGANTRAKKVKMQPDGKILVLGGLGSGWEEMFLARYNKNGSIDTGFGTNGIVIRSFSATAKSINDFALQSDGKIIVAGYFRSATTQSDDFLVARFNQDGSFDTTFGTNGIATVNQSAVDIFNTVVVQPDNKIIAAGTTSQNNYEFAAIRFNADGTLDQSFANGGLFFYDLGQFRQNQEFRAAAVLPNGQILLGGTGVETGGGAGIDALIKLESNGAFAQNFGTGGVVDEYFGTYSAGFNYDLDVLPDGKIQTISARLFRRLLSNGTPDPGFRNRYFPYETIDLAGTALDARSDGKIIVLNQGSSFGQHTILYNPDGRDISYAKDLTGADVVVQTDNKFIVISNSALGDGIVLKRFIAISSPGTRLANFDYDEKTDLAVLRGGTTVQVQRSIQGAITYQLQRVPGDFVRIMPEDYTTTDFYSLTYWRVPQQNGAAYFETIRQNSDRQSTFQWGAAGDIPIGGDYDGESSPNFILRYHKRSEFGIFRPSTGDWWIANPRTGSYFTVHWGAAGDKPVPADYDYDGITDYAIYRPSTGTWWVHRSADDSYFTLQFGSPADIPLTGDYDGDGRADFTVYRPSEGTWYQYLTSEGYRIVQFGVSTDVPVPGDYDGDGKHDIAVFRDGTWYLLQSTEGLKVVQWGGAGDVPIATRYDR